MLNCHNATRLMSEKLERKLSLREAINLRFHLMMCSGCSNFDAQMGSLRQLSRVYAKGKGAAGAPPPDDGEEPGA
ncbi:zf-HC2 domain-containing protein [Uliginosibacterium sediminicola]|uniref:Zf-HC2 domain-containing protein n=1 Tax=Uliginosibacterium sediminicola TaxID=2024550 RepID=A0ABU9YYK3_9RHOO